MMLDIGRKMFMMRIRDCQFRVFGVRKVIVPVEPFHAAIDFVSVRCNDPRFEIQLFMNAQTDAIREENFPLGYACKGAVRPNRDRRTLHLDGQIPAPQNGCRPPTVGAGCLS